MIVYLCSGATLVPKSWDTCGVTENLFQRSSFIELLTLPWRISAMWAKLYQPSPTSCFLRCADFIPEPYHGEIIQGIANGIAQHNLERDYTRWKHGYFVKPYWYARTPDSSLYLVLKDEIERCLDFDIQTQEPDGSARLTFRVEGEARNIWKSVWTLESLRMLQAYGRIEGEQAW